MQRGPNSNDDTIAFFSRVQARCPEIASLHPSQHDAEIIKLRDETGLTPVTLIPIIERYAYQRIPDYPALATQFIEQIGREKVRAMLATGYGQRALRSAAQAFLTDQRLTVTGPRLGLLLAAVRAQFQTKSPHRHGGEGVFLRWFDDLSGPDAGPNRNLNLVL